ARGTKTAITAIAYRVTAADTRGSDVKEALNHLYEWASKYQNHAWFRVEPLEDNCCRVQLVFEGWGRTQGLDYVFDVELAKWGRTDVLLHEAKRITGIFDAKIAEQ